MSDRSARESGGEEKKKKKKKKKGSKRSSSADNNRIPKRRSGSRSSGSSGDKYELSEEPAGGSASTMSSVSDDEEEIMDMSPEDLRNELAAISEMQRKHRQELTDKVHKIKEYFAKGTMGEEKLYMFLDRLEEVETSLNEEDLQSFVELGRRVLHVNQIKRREALGCTIDPAKKEKAKKDEEDLNKLIYTADYVTFSLESYSESDSSAVDWSKFDSVFTDADTLGRDMWVRLFHKDDSVTWNAFADAFLGKTKPRTHKHYKALHMVLGDEVSVNKFVNFLKWFGPKTPGDKLLRNMVHVLKTPGFCGDVSPVEQENLIKEASVGSYLIRFSNEPGDYTLVVRNQATSAMKVKIESGAGMPFKIAAKEYPTLHHLIEENRKQLKLKLPVKGSKYELMFTSHRKRKLANTGRKLNKKGSHNNLIEGNYQYINAFELMEEAKKPARKFTRSRNRTPSISKADDFFKAENAKCYCSCMYKKEEAKKEPLCSTCLKVNRDGPLSTREQEIVAARLALLDDVIEFCELMVRNRAATFQADIGMEIGEDTTSAREKSGHHTIRRRETNPAIITMEFVDKDSDENIEYDLPEVLSGGSGRKQTFTKAKIRAATLEKLLEKMTTSDAFPEDDLHAFLLTHSLFISTEELMQVLRLRCLGASSPSPVRLKVLRLIETWFTSYPQDFASLELLDEAATFMKQVASESVSKEAKDMKELAIKIRQDMKMLQKELLAEKIQPVNPLLFQTREEQEKYLLSNLDEKKFPKPSMKKPKARELEVDKLDVVETARQLTLIEHYLLKRIRNSEFFSVAWEKKSKDIEAPNIVNFISRFNQVTSWVTSEIVSRKNIKLRAAIMEFFIDVAVECKQLHSYNVVMQILFALKGNAISRLNKTWEVVKLGHREKYDQLVLFGSIMKNFNNYREEFANCSPPYVPFLSTSLKDMAGIDAIPSYVDKKINMSKVRKMAAAIQACKKNDADAYPLEPVQFLYQFLLFKLQVLDQRALFELSLQCEPRVK